MKLGMEELGMGVVRSIKSSRRWCWQDKDILDFIRESFSGQRLTTALAIYLSLTELASNQGSDEFQAYFSQIAKLSGKSIPTIKSYSNQFIRIGILKKKNRKVDVKTNLSNQWFLLTPSVNNNYPTSVNNSYPTSVDNDYQQLEENELEKDNKKILEFSENKNSKKEIKKSSETPAYKKLREKADQLRRTTHA